MKKNIGDWILSAIEMENKTQKEIAEALSLAPQTLNSYIMNRRVPDIDTLCRIMRYLNMDANRTLGLEIAYDLVPSKEEIALLKHYRALDDEHKEFAFFILARMPKQEESMESTH